MEFLLACQSVWDLKLFTSVNGAIVYTQDLPIGGEGRPFRSLNLMGGYQKRCSKYRYIGMSRMRWIAPKRLEDVVSSSLDIPQVTARSLGFAFCIARQEIQTSWFEFFSWRFLGLASNSASQVLLSHAFIGPCRKSYLTLALGAVGFAEHIVLARHWAYSGVAELLYGFSNLSWIHQALHPSRFLLNRSSASHH